LGLKKKNRDRGMSPQLRGENAPSIAQYILHIIRFYVQNYCVLTY